LSNQIASGDHCTWQAGHVRRLDEGVVERVAAAGVLAEEDLRALPVVAVVAVVVVEEPVGVVVVVLVDEVHLLRPVEAPQRVEAGARVVGT
jgi:hypothetical protein